MVSLHKRPGGADVSGSAGRSAPTDEVWPAEILEIEFYDRKDGRAVILAVPYGPPAEPPDEECDLWLVTGRVSSAGTPAR